MAAGRVYPHANQRRKAAGEVHYFGASGREDHELKIADRSVRGTPAFRGQNARATRSREFPTTRSVAKVVNPHLRKGLPDGIKEYVESSTWLAGLFMKLSRTSGI